MSIKVFQKTVLLPVIAILTLCVVFFILFTGPISDGDCFWHLATGRWIKKPCKPILSSGPTGCSAKILRVKSTG
jgi:hypothetical protein